jgi:hypothetical protein
MCLVGIAWHKIETLTIQKAVISVCIIYCKRYPTLYFAHTANLLDLFGSYKKYIFLTFPDGLTLVSYMQSGVLDIRHLSSSIA